MARRRRFSEEPFGPTVERLMGETGVTYRALADKTKLSAGYLNHLVHGNRPVPADKVVRQLAKALTMATETEIEELVYTDMRKRFPLELGDAEEERSAG